MKYEELELFVAKLNMNAYQVDIFHNLWRFVTSVSWPMHESRTEGMSTVFLSNFVPWGNGKHAFITPYTF